MNEYDDWQDFECDPPSSDEMKELNRTRVKTPLKSPQQFSATFWN